MRVRILFFLYIILPTSRITYAQITNSTNLLSINKIYVGFAVTPLANFSHFSGNSYIDNSFRKPPFLTKAIGLSIRQNISKRIALKSGVSIINLGYRENITGNYQGGRRYQNTSSGTNSFGLVQIPTEIYYMINKKKSNI